MTMTKIKHYYQNIGEDWFTYPYLYSLMVGRFPDGSKFVEVGSWRGRSACYLGVEIYNSGKQIYLDCIDTWEGSKEHNLMGIDVSNNLLYKEFLNNIEPLRSIIKPIRLTSEEASFMYEDESLDFVFIDASHKYEDVVQDMRLWFPKVKGGGMFCGHDYSPNWPDVVRAVNEFFTNINGNFTTQEHCWVHRKDNV